MRKQPTVKELKKEVSALKREVRDLRDRNLHLRSDKERLIFWIEDKFNWFIDMLAEGKTPCLRFLIKNTKDMLVKVKE